MIETRGLSPGSVRSFGLGYVSDPLPGHEQYAGRLSIPYLTRAGTTTIRFRAVPGTDGNIQGPKYLSVPGDEPRIYNPLAFFRHEPFIAICEGEMDTITAEMAGIPSVGIAGVAAWREHFGRCFRGYSKVFILADSDDKGQGHEFAERIAPQVENARIAPMPDGHDVNSFVKAEGVDALLDRLGIKP